jgi:hypothetical protein
MKDFADPSSRFGLVSLTEEKRANTAWTPPFRHVIYTRARARLRYAHVFDSSLDEFDSIPFHPDCRLIASY